MEASRALQARLKVACKRVLVQFGSTPEKAEEVAERLVTWLRVQASEGERGGCGKTLTVVDNCLAFATCLRRTDRDRTLKLARRARGVTPRDLADAGIHRQMLTRLVAEGQLERVARGVYRLAERPITEHHGLSVAAAAVPHGVVCLLSALQVHGIGSQLPSEVWMAIDRRAWRPTLAPSTAAHRALHRRSH